MKIDSIIATPVRVPVKRVGQFTRARRTHAERTIVQIICNDGFVGIGETRGLDAARIINHRFAASIVGRSVQEFQGIRASCLPNVPDFGYPEQLVDLNAFAAIDMALWDLAGKRAGLPVYELLGGAVRDAAPYVAYEYTVDPEEGGSLKDVPRKMAEKALHAIKETGATFFEFKVGVYSVDCDIDTVREVRHRLGSGIELGVDSNMSYSYDDASRFLDGVKECRLANVEEPVSSLANMNALAARYTANVSSHCTSPDMLMNYPHVSGAVGDPHAEGGLLAIRDLSNRFVALGRRYWFRSVWELGISWSAMIHMVMAFPALERPMQALFNHVTDDLIIEDDLAMSNGKCIASQRPGLGVTLDEGALSRYSVAATNKEAA